MSVSDSDHLRLRMLKPRELERVRSRVELARLTEAERRANELQSRFDHHRDWNQQRYNALRKWVQNEVRPLSDSVADRYFAIVANGGPSPYEQADWTGTLHVANLQRDAALAKLTEAEKELEGLRQTMRDIAEQDCFYGDNCPTFGTNHGQCTGCRAREALAALDGKGEG